MRSGGQRFWVELSRKARRHYERVDTDTAARLDAALEAMEEDPFLSSRTCSPFFKSLRNPDSIFQSFTKIEPSHDLVLEHNEHYEGRHHQNYH